MAKKLSPSVKSKKRKQLFFFFSGLVAVVITLFTLAALSTGSFDFRQQAFDPYPVLANCTTTCQSSLCQCPPDSYRCNRTGYVSYGTSCGGTNPQITTPTPIPQQDNCAQKCESAQCNCPESLNCRKTGLIYNGQYCGIPDLKDCKTVCNANPVCNCPESLGCYVTGNIYTDSTCDGN